MSPVVTMNSVSQLKTGEKMAGRVVKAVSFAFSSAILAAVYSSHRWSDLLGSCGPLLPSCIGTRQLSNRLKPQSISVS